jgi:hypothetical protein
VAGHVFISYQHDPASSAYVERFAEFLRSQGIEPWFDRGIVTGDRWEQVIREHLVSCAAFVVVMTPAGEQSRWIRREINEAEAAGRPVLPLLLDGERFFSLADVQFHDVRGGRLPGREFVDQLRTLIAQTGPPVRSAAPTPSLAHVGRPRRRGRAALMTFAAAVSIAAVASGVVYATANQRSPSGPEAFSSSTPTPTGHDTPTLTTTTSFQPITSPPATSQPVTPTTTTTPPPTCSAPVEPPANWSEGGTSVVPGIKGTVADIFSNCAIPGAVVIVQDSANNTFQVATNATGGFEIVSTPAKQIQPGVVAFVVSKNGFKQASMARQGLAGQGLVNVVIRMAPV